MDVSEAMERNVCKCDSSACYTGDVMTMRWDGHKKNLHLSACHFYIGTNIVIYFRMISTYWPPLMVMISIHWEVLNYFTIICKEKLPQLLYALTVLNLSLEIVLSLFEFLRL